MGGHRRRRSSGTTTTPPPTTTFPTPRPGTEYEDDNVNRMPLMNTLSQAEAMRRVIRNLTGRSGRGSTRLVTDSGVRPYTASLLGGTN